MADRKPTTANVDKDHLPVAYAMLFIALEAALTHIAKQAGTEDWHRDLYDIIQKTFDDMNASAMMFTPPNRSDAPAHIKDMPGAIRAGSATVDAAFDAVIAKMQGGADGDPAA